MSLRPTQAACFPETAPRAGGHLLVSAIIPTHNYGRYLTEAVQSALNQTYSHLEVIVVDDGSTDNTRELMQPLQDRVCYIRQEQRGPSAARNAGIKVARGELIAFLDADDVWLREKTTLQVAHLQGHPQVGLVCSRTGLMGCGAVAPGCGECAAGGNAWSLPAGLAFADLFLRHRNCIATSTVMLRGECLERVGMFDESLRRVEDFNLWLRIGRYYGIARLPQTLALHRYHGANLAASRSAMRRAVFVNLDRICALYPETRSVRRRVASRLYLKHGLQDLYERRPREARASIKAAICQHALNAPAYPLLLASYCPQSMLDAARALTRLGRRCTHAVKLSARQAPRTAGAAPLQR